MALRLAGPSNDVGMAMAPPLHNHMATASYHHLGGLAGVTSQPWSSSATHPAFLTCAYHHTKTDQHSVVQLPQVWFHFWAWKWTQKWDSEITHFSCGVGLALAPVCACLRLGLSLLRACSGIALGLPSNPSLSNAEKGSFLSSEMGPESGPEISRFL